VRGRKWRIEWNEEAIADLSDIRAYIADRNPDAGERVVERLTSGTRLLATTPLMARRGRVVGTRELVFADIPYIAVYTLYEDRRTAEILRVIHTARLWPQPED
jgi:addiction module RelE/StbE family toxin